MEKKNIIDSWEQVRAENENGAPRRLYAMTDYGERLFKAQEVALRYLNMGGW